MRKKYGIYIGSLMIIVLLTGLDQWTKYDVVRGMDLGESIVLIPKLFELTYVQNTGAGFSIFLGYGKVFFAVLTLAAMAGILWFYFKSSDPGVQLSLSLIFAGALGNFIDRMARGYVVDFFHVYIFGWSFPIFNVADICITLGFVFLVIHMLVEEYKGVKRT